MLRMCSELCHLCIKRDYYAQKTCTTVNTYSRSWVNYENCDFRYCIGPFPFFVKLGIQTSCLLAIIFLSGWRPKQFPIMQVASTVVQKHVDKFFCQLSTPKQLCSDQEKQFKSNVVKDRDLQDFEYHKNKDNGSAMNHTAIVLVECSSMMHVMMKCVCFMGVYVIFVVLIFNC